MKLEDIKVGHHYLFDYEDARLWGTCATEPVTVIEILNNRLRVKDSQGEYWFAEPGWLSPVTSPITLTHRLPAPTLQTSLSPDDAIKLSRDGGFSADDILKLYPFYSEGLK